MNQHPHKNTRQFGLFAVVALSVLTLSQAIGYWVNETIPLHSSIEINPFLFFTHVRNHGGVFGLLQGQGWVFGLFSAVLLGGVAAYLRFGEALARAEYLCFGLIVGGGASNVLDRLIYGSVIDFIDVHLPYYRFPAFNVADSCICVGVGLYVIMSYRHDRLRREAIVSHGGEDPPPGA